MSVDQNKFLAARAMLFFLCVTFLQSVNAFGGGAPPAPEMPPHWRVISDFQVPAEQVMAMSGNLDADLSSVRNIVFDVNGKRVQVNIIVAPDAVNAGKLMTRLRSMKVEEALLQKGLTIYEFVGQNDVLPLIAEGRRYLEAR